MSDNDDKFVRFEEEAQSVYARLLVEAVKNAMSAEAESDGIGLARVAAYTAFALHVIKQTRAVYRPGTPQRKVIDQVCLTYAGHSIPEFDA